MYSSGSGKSLFFLYLRFFWPFLEVVWLFVPFLDVGLTAFKKGEFDFYERDNDGK